MAVWAGTVLLMVAGAASFGPAKGTAQAKPGALNKAWSYSTGEKLIYAPLPAAGRLFVASEQHVFALDVERGTLDWKFSPAEGEVWPGSMVVRNGMVYIGAHGGQYYALAADSGKVEWKHALEINSVKPALFHQDRLYIPTTHVWPPKLKSNPEGKAKLVVLDARTGARRDEFTTSNYILATPRIEGSRLFLSGNYQGPKLSDESGYNRIYALSLEHGLSQLWTYESHDGFAKSLHAEGGVLNYLGYEDYISGIDTRTGKRLWRVHTGNWVQGFTPSDGKIYYGSALNKVVAIDQSKGNTLWRYPIPDKNMFSTIIGSPVIHAGAVYWIRNLNQQFTAVSASTGKLLWFYPTDLAEESQAEPAVTDRRIFMVSFDGRVLAYDFPRH